MYGKHIFTIFMPVGIYDIAWAIGLLCAYSLLRPKFARVMYHMILEILRLVCSVYMLYIIGTIGTQGSGKTS